MLQLFRGATLVAATMTMGLMAGLFYVFAHAIMPGLGRSDDRTFVGAYQAIDKAIVNPWFLASFLGALVLTVLAAVLHLGGDGRTVLPWTAAALVLYVVAIVITVRINIPLNNRIQAAGAPDRIADLATVREQFEARWVRWNIARGAATTAALGCLTWALVLHGRTTISGGA
ncbi:MAG TPA: anthrone oxygenase family protein [Actinomycetes bacterium]|nr:anthrone oxygenase family protein [Actinomycetes bacterium]